MSQKFTKKADSHVEDEKHVFYSYVKGFVFSLILTLLAYFSVTEKWLKTPVLIATIIALGILQMWIQLFCFLHLGSETKPRWNLLSFLFMAVVVLILVGGSLWIMFNLDERTMQFMPHMMNLREQQL